MLFKDQAESLVAKWENLRIESDLGLMAAHTAVALSKVDNVSVEILDHLDSLLGYKCKRLGRATYDITKYLRSLCDENRPKTVEQPLILRA